MATLNPFDLLGDNDSDDPSLLIAAHQQTVVSRKPAAALAAPAAPAAKLPSKPLPPAQAVREAREVRGDTVPARGRGGRGASGHGNENSDGFFRGRAGGGEAGNSVKHQEMERPSQQPFNGVRHSGSGGRGGYGSRRRYGNEEASGDADQPPRRTYERSGTGSGYEMKPAGYGRRNWGTQADEANAHGKEEKLNTNEKGFQTEKQSEQEGVPSAETTKDDKERIGTEPEEKEEDKEMTLEVYEKIREEKRKALLSTKAEERRVEIDKDLKSMQQLSAKKENDAIFVKLGSHKESGKKKDSADRDERTKKSMSINEFLKPAEGERYHNPSGRGRGRGRGDRGYFRGGFGGGDSYRVAAAPSIGDAHEFPTLGGK